MPSAKGACAHYTGTKSRIKETDGYVSGIFPLETRVPNQSIHYHPSYSEHLSIYGPLHTADCSDYSHTIGIEPFILLLNASSLFMKPVERILVPMDGSPLSQQALRIAFAEYPDATIKVLHTIDPTQPGYSYPIDVETENEPLHGSEEWYARSEELAEQLFAEVRKIAAEYDADVTTETIVGEPGREIIDYATKNDIEQIIIGSHGRDENEGLLLGRVTETVVFRSPVRVLLVR